MGGVVQGPGERILVALIIGRRKKLISKLNNVILVFNILPTLSSPKRLIYTPPPIPPDGPATSQYHLALLRLFFGWLLCVPSSIGGHLRPPNNLFVFIFHHYNHCPNRCDNVPPTRSNPHAPPLQNPSHLGRQLLFDCCVFQLNGSHLRPIHLYLSIFLMCLHSAPQTGKPAIAPPNPTPGTLRWIIGSRGAIGWWRQ